MERKMRQTIFLIGGFGFVGRNIIDHIQANHTLFPKCEIMVIDNLSNAADQYETVECATLLEDYNSSSTYDFVRKNSQNTLARTFIFLAGETRVAESKDRPLDFIHANISEPARFINDNLNEGDKFILVSTAGALFDGTTEITENTPISPKNFYGATKAGEELILQHMVNSKGGEFKVVRMTNVYGKFSDKKKSAIHSFVRASLDNTTITVNGDGKQTRDFVFASDVGRAISNLALRRKWSARDPKVHILGSGHSTSLNEVIESIQQISKYNFSISQVSATELLKTEPRDVLIAKNSVSQLFDGDLTSLEAGIRSTFHYYKDRI